MRIILLGPPGSGKGTQGDLIAQKCGFPEISTGDLLRAAVRNKTPLGKKAEAAMRRGDLVSDDLVMQVVAERIAREDCRKGYILDGFPRTIGQARMLDAAEERQAEVVLDIRASEEELIKRLSSRRVCPRCGSIYNLLVKAPDESRACDICRTDLVQRQDDLPEVVRERLRVYHEETEPLVLYYQKKGNYHKIEGDKPIGAVFQDIQAVLKKKLADFDQTEAVR